MDSIIRKTDFKIILINLCIILLMVTAFIPRISTVVEATINDELETVMAENTNELPKLRIHQDMEDHEIVDYKLDEDITIQLTKSQAEQLDEYIAQEKARKQALKEKQTVYASRNLNAYEISVYTDLSAMREVTVQEMDQIINYWASKAGGSPFVGHAQAFIDASKETGLDPVYLLAHAGLESAWGKSEIARDKFNYFGIGAFDSSPYSSSLHMGDSVYNGIVSGANWIARNYYNNGQSSLYTMRYNGGSHEYCTSTTWMYNIVDIIQTSYSLIS